MDDWVAVAAAMSERMHQLRLTQREVAERSGVSVATLRQIQNGYGSRTRRARTLAGISVALGWPADYLANVLTGAAPPPPSEPTDSQDRVLTKLEEIHDELRELRGLLDDHKHA